MLTYAIILTGALVVLVLVRLVYFLGYRAGGSYAVSRAEHHMRACAKESFDLGYLRGHEDGWMDGARVFGKRVDGNKYPLLSRIGRELDA